MRIIISAVIATFTFVAWTTSVSAQDPAVVNAKTINQSVNLGNGTRPPTSGF
jgi:hypothetical protein